MTTTERVLYTRREHGTLPVRVRKDGRARSYELGDTTFGTFRGLMTHLNGGRDPKVGFERYFRVGRHDLRPPVVLSPLEMFRIVPGVRYIHIPKRGVNLDRKWVDVERLFRHGFYHGLVGVAGYDQEDIQDVLQDIYLGLVARNRGKGAWDPSRSKFGYYITLVCRSVVSNHFRKRQRRLQRETIGIRGCCDHGRAHAWEDVGSADWLVGTTGDLEGADSCLPMEDLEGYIASRPDRGRKDSEIARKILPYVALGMRRGEIALSLGMSKASVGRALSFLREATRAWRGV